MFSWKWYKYFHHVLLVCWDTMWPFSTKKILVKPFVFVCKPSMFPNIFVIVLKHWDTKCSSQESCISIVWDMKICLAPTKPGRAATAWGQTRAKSDQISTLGSRFFPNLFWTSIKIWVRCFFAFCKSPVRIMPCLKFYKTFRALMFLFQDPPARPIPRISYT